MNWNTDKKSSNDNLQVVLVCKYITIRKKSAKYRDGIFLNGDTGRFGRFVAVEIEKSMVVSGANGDVILVNFDKEHEEQLDQYSVLSVHWNNKGVGNCGKDKGSIWCNGKKLSTFTVEYVEGDSVFAIGASNQHNEESIQGEIGRIIGKRF